jgi:thiol-disulfide isomerase/thioredoxin
LYKETGDESWLEKCDWIVSHFEEWEKKYGLWLSPYTDNTEIRAVFMISVAVASLMRYYRVRPQEKIKAMILRAVDDLVENARLDNGLFYYKELPSLKRFGNNPIILEALTIAYEITGNADYLKAGIPTLKYVVARGANGGGSKKIVGDTVMSGTYGTKNFAQLMTPVTTYYAACAGEGIEIK